MNKDPDETLVERCRRGDRGAFAELVDRYQRPIYNAAYRVLGNAEDAADIAQAVFLTVAERLDEFNAQYKFFSWIYRITINKALNLQRHNVHEQALEDDNDVPDTERTDPEWQARLAQLAGRVQVALMTLSIEDRVVITLRHFSDLSYREIGHVLELQEKTVKSRLFEARQRLRDLLHDYEAA